MSNLELWPLTHSFRIIMQGDWNNNAFPVPVVWRWALITIELKTWVFSFTMKWKQKNISKRLINTFGSKVYIIHSLTNWTSIYPRWPVVLYITFSSNEKGYEYLQRITVAKQSLLWENEIQTRLFLVDWLSGSKERYWRYNRIQHKDIVMLFNWYNMIWQSINFWNGKSTPGLIKQNTKYVTTSKDFQIHLNQMKTWGDELCIQSWHWMIWYMTK